jgi:conjugative relaxase-like TrwC/TraI family protein
VLTVSKALAVSQARDYYRREYTSPGESYYVEGEESRGRWHGRLAERWGLRGEVTDEQYERLCNGQHPETGEQLVRHLESRTYTNRYGKEVTTRGHRAGWDATFSAPKTVSLAAVVGGDERVRAAHRESVDAALDALEPSTQARMGGNRPAEMTGRMLAAKFEHTAARPDRQTGYAAPQLHTHVLVFNVTETESGVTKPVQPLELYRSQRYATVVYRINLAERLHRLGYEVEVDPRTGAPEIKGFDPEYVRESSPRSAEVRRSAERMKARLEEEGASVKEGAGLRQAAARADRAGKEYDRREMRERALALDAKYGHQAERLYQAAMERGPVMYDAEEVGRRAREAVAFARESAVGREEAVDRRELMADAFRRNLGLTTYEAVRSELAEREAQGEFVGLIKEHGQQRSTSDRTLRIEGENFQRVPDGRGTLTSMLESGRGRTAELTEIVRQRDPGLKHAVEGPSAGEVKAAVERLQADGGVVEIPDDRARLRAVAADYCARPAGTLVIAPANRERMALNTMIHDGLHREGKVGAEEHATKVYVSREEMTGEARTSAGSYVPGEDVVRFNRGSRIYGVKAGDYARVMATDREKNIVTALTEDRRELKYNPARLQGVSVYREGERLFSEGDRVQFRAPFKKHRIAGGELGTVSRIEGDRFGIRLDDRRTVSFGTGEFRHLDHGYAVTGYSSQGQAVDRVLVHADTREPEALLNRQMGHVGLVGAGDGARVYTNDAGALSDMLDQRVDKQTALEATARGKELGRPGPSLGMSGVEGAGAEAVGTEQALSQSLEMGLML